MSARDERVEFVIAASDAGRRLDQLLVEHIPGLKRRGATTLFARGDVRVDGRRARKGDPARSGARVIVTLSATQCQGTAVAEAAALDVVLETAHYVVVNKPAGQPSTPLSASETGTLANALLGRYPEMRDIGFSPLEPGLLHRLDVETSGLLVAARSGIAFERLRAAFKSGALDKRYLALVRGETLEDSGVIELPLAPDRRHPRRVRVCATLAERGARHAVTRFRVLERWGAWTLVELSAARAFRHQIRAHLAAKGYPIAGDRIYAGPTHPALGTRHALHASYLAWAGDETLPAFAATAALPAEMAAARTG